MEAQLTGVEADPRTRVDSEGNAKATEPKSRLLGPVIALIVATQSMERADSTASASAEGSSANSAIAGISGFGLLGAAAARASSKAGTVLGFYGLGWSVYSTVISRGKEVEFQKNAALEIRFGSPLADPATKLGNHFAGLLPQ
jgi:hypothetical protein